jgi:hypothetical protein
MKLDRSTTFLAAALTALFSMFAVVAWTSPGGAASGPEERVPTPGARGIQLTADLAGASEVPGPGDPEAVGTIVMNVRPGKGRICYELTTEGLDAIAAAHIHKGAADAAGSVVVDLAPDADGRRCVTGLRPRLLRNIRNAPGKFYVNVHTAEFPDGAIRGQLEAAS